MLLSICFSLLLPCSYGFNFLILGDWGGQEASPYYKDAQLLAAKGMAKIAKTMNPEFILTVGDNFYDHGIDIHTMDMRYTTTWKDIYTDSSLQIPWYLIGGNHDWYGNITAQLEFSKRDSLWEFPSLYRDHHFDIGGVDMHIILIDTVVLAGLDGIPPSDPRYYNAEAAELQWTWLANTMASSKSSFIFVAGHYPVYSVCENGPNKIMIKRLKPLLEQYGAHYISGHDHCQEYFDYNSVKYILTGAGDECCYKASNLQSVPSGAIEWYVSKEINPTGVVAGFASMSMTPFVAQLNFYDQDGNVLYGPVSIPPRGFA